MNHNLNLRLTTSDGALLRVIGVVERRGFKLRRCVVDDDGEGASRVRLDVNGTRDPQLLCRQLDRLLDVSGVVRESASSTGTPDRSCRRRWRRLLPPPAAI